MATIQTAEGNTLIVEGQSRNPTLFIEARLDCDGFGRDVDERLFSIYGISANPHTDLRPRSRGDLTVEAMEDLANRLVGWAVAEGLADRRSDVVIERIDVQERDTAKTARRPYVPDWEDDWPGDGSRSDQVRYLLDNQPTFTDEEIAAGVGCSRSLVLDIKSGDE